MTRRSDSADGPARRDEILAAAATLFAEHGVHAVSTRKIAQQVGISQPSIYAHFTSLREIQEEVSARAFAQLEERLVAAAAHAPDERLRQCVHTYLDFGMSHPHAYRIAFMIEHPGGDEPDAFATFLATDHPGPRAFEQVLHTVAAVRPDLTHDGIRMRARSLWAMLHGLVSLLLARPGFPWEDRARLLAEHAALAEALVRM